MTKSDFRLFACWWAIRAKEQQRNRRFGSKTMISSMQQHLTPNWSGSMEHPLLTPAAATTTAVEASAASIWNDSSSMKIRVDQSALISPYCRRSSTSIKRLHLLRQSNHTYNITILLLSIIIFAVIIKFLSILLFCLSILKPVGIDSSYHRFHRLFVLYREILNLCRLYRTTV